MPEYIFVTWLASFDRCIKIASTDPITGNMVSVPLHWGPIKFERPVITSVSVIPAMILGANSIFGAFIDSSMILDFGNK